MIIDGQLSHSPDDYSPIADGRTINAPVGCSTGEFMDYKTCNNTMSHTHGALGNPQELGRHIDRYLADIVVERLEEGAVTYMSDGRRIPYDLQAIINSIVIFHHPQVPSNTRASLSEAIKAKLLIIKPEEESFYFWKIREKDFRMAVDQVLWEDELAELDGEEAPFTEIRRIKADTESRREIMMDRIRAGGRVIAKGESLEQVMKNVKAQQQRGINGQ